MRTIGLKNKKLVKKITIETLKQRDIARAGETMRYYGIDNEIANKLPTEIWQTWEGADGEIRNIIDETIKEYDKDIVY